MTEDQALALTGTLAALALVVGSLLVRRFPMKQFWWLALIWAAIFAGLFLILRLFPGLIGNLT